MVQGYFVMTTGNTRDSHKNFLDHLTISSKFYEVRAVNESDVIFAFVPVVSRAGTDIQSAMEIIPKDKPVVLVMLHHTFDPDIVLPDIRPYVDRTDVFVVDCLFHEDRGLLRCLRNDDAIKAVKDHLSRMKVEYTSYKRKVLAVVIGAVIGAVSGAVIHSALGVTPCDTCNNEYAGAGAGTVTGIGAGIGAVIGLVFLINAIAAFFAAVFGVAVCVFFYFRSFNFFWIHVLVRDIVPAIG
ncbi:uncharacterized protein LOC132838597 isoform X2 [Tachysurus vachellii]|uniref:uncharacterized protein LOC132838597 isoform X2 n=1 Tax=Tachysurus vachellii TaxID=175792 RepID=UPI00296AA76B|nr:uncharacterized protein LOC132838597 isoform X2 [Tachysurus vachellii]